MSYKKDLKDLILSLREMFEDEFRTELNKFGIYSDKEWMTTSEFNEQIKMLDKEKQEDLKETRIAVKSVIDKEAKETEDRGEAVDYYIKEVAYTYINRLIGLKCLEVRDIIDEVITIRQEYGGLSEQHRNFLEQNPEYREKNDSGLKELLINNFQEITKEIKVLFNPNNEFSYLFPDFTVVSNAIAMINKKLDYEDWKRDDILGWVYQYFNEEEREEFKDSSRKANANDLPVATQVYTPDWIVKYMVDNSLGTYWAEMHSETTLIDELDLEFSPDHKLGTRKKKSVKDIKVLDPACGSGHFLIYAFDLLYEMYLEEGQVAEEKIPYEIVKNNLYGIDVDRRAVQLTALSLYMKVKQTTGLEAEFSVNLVAADAILLNSERLENFIERNGLQNSPDVVEVIEEIWDRLNNVRKLGSLLKVEEDLEELVREKKLVDENNEQLKLMSDFDNPKQEKLKVSREKRLKNILSDLKKLLSDSLESFDVNEQLFANEALKGINLLTLLDQKYDIVITNPPYLSNRNYSPSLKDILKSIYPETYENLYGAFIERNIDLLKQNGKLAMITIHTYMFTSTWKDLRDIILNTSWIEKYVHFGLDAMDYAKAETSLFIFELTSDKNRRGIYYNLKQNNNYFKFCRDKNPGIKFFNEINSNDECKYYMNQKNFERITGNPFIYWATPKALNILENIDSLGNKNANSISGMKTAKNSKYLRYPWEIKLEKSDKQWKRYFKSVSGYKYYKSFDRYIDWSKEAINHYKNYRSAQLYNEKYWHKNAIATGLYSSKAHTGIYAKGEFMVDMAANLTLPISFNYKYGLAFLNSTYVEYILGLLNPTNNFQPGDLKRIPFKTPDESTNNKVCRLSNKCINIKKRRLKFIIKDSEFKKTSVEWANDKIDKVKSIKKLFKRYRNYKEENNVKFYLFEAIIDKKIFDLYNIESKDLEAILKSEGKPIGWYPLVEGYTEFETEDQDINKYIKELDVITLSNEQIVEIGNAYCNKNQDDSLAELCSEYEINPISLYNIILEKDLICQAELEFEVKQFLSHLILKLLKEDEDGIIPLVKDAGDEPLREKIREEYRKLFGQENEYNLIDETEKILGNKKRKTINNWLDINFFKFHSKQFKKAPLVWHFRSKNKYFGVYLYYHKLNQDTLNKLKANYLWELRDNARRRKRELNQKEELTKDEREELDEVVDRLEDINDFEQKLDQVIEDGFELEIDKGIRKNAKPFRKAGLFSYKKKI
ncbi:BREX-1 system adenine-specific DNA-methyltransferase PglX [Halanaerocella petrolearia]